LLNAFFPKRIKASSKVYVKVAVIKVGLKKLPDKTTNNCSSLIIIDRFFIKIQYTCYALRDEK